MSHEDRDSDLPQTEDDLDALPDFDLNEFLDEDGRYEEGDFDDVT